MKNVEIVRHATIANGLEACFGKPPSGKTMGIVLSTLHLDRKTKAKLEAEEELASMLLEPLTGEYETENRYRRTLAVASLPWEMEVREVYQKLREKEYYPASFSEGMSYLPVLVAKGIVLDTVFHLGTFLRNEKNTEFRLRTKSKGEVELVPFYHSTLKAYYSLIVVKKEKK
ncbi:MAG: hypothetical protein NTV60_03260 [Candidatus Kaiserbacteria bacterium]|nr:hypothetical protein [Candidatus Kaiserbacteria bacterium]